jgi:hypothetical protein
LKDVKKNFDQYLLALENAKPLPRDPNLDRTLLGPLAKGPRDQREDSPFLSGVGLNTRATNRHADATDKDTKANERNTMSLKDQMNAMKEATDQRIAALNAEIGYQDSLDAANKAIKENGRTATEGGKKLDVTTQKGRDNALALYAVADGWNGLSKRMKNAPGAFAEAKKNFVDLAERMGLSKDAAKRLADQILELPSKKIVHVTADTEPAKKKVSEFQRLVNSLRDKHITITATYATDATGFRVHKDGHMGGTLLRAQGGPVWGPGGPTSDSIPAWLSNGEYVINARATARHRALLEAINSHRYASGGYVGSGSAAGTTLSLSRSDAAVLAAAVREGRSIYGDVHVHGDNSFRREVEQRRREAGGGVTF